MLHTIPVQDFEALVAGGVWVGHVFYKGDTRLCITSIGQIKNDTIEIGIESASDYPTDSVWESCLESIQAIS
jgi:hypothetical protein